MDWFLYGRELRQEKVNIFQSIAFHVTTGTA